MKDYILKKKKKVSKKRFKKARNQKEFGIPDYGWFISYRE